MKAVAVWIWNIEIVFWYLNHALKVRFDINNLIFDIIADDKMVFDHIIKWKTVKVQV